MGYGLWVMRYVLCVMRYGLTLGLRSEAKESKQRGCQCGNVILTFDSRSVF